jgi:hypothetical protein
MTTSRPTLARVLARWYRALWALGKTHDWNLNDEATRRLWKERRRAGRRANDELWRTARECHRQEKGRGR